MFRRWLFKLDRIIIWPLLFATVIYLLSGYSLTYHFYAHKIISQGLASRIHTPFCFAFLVLFLAHSFIAIYFAILRSPSKPHLSIRISRWSGWLLLISTLIMMVSGYSMTSKPKAIHSFTAIRLHNTFSSLVILFFILHAGINSYFIIRKWVRK